MGWMLPAAMVVGSALQYISQDQTNQANIGLSREQMGFQERMSSTAYQRAVQDMKAAGLNPAMMYSHGGMSASTPIGAKADLKSPGEAAGKNFAEAVFSAMQIKNMEKDLELKDKQSKILSFDAKIKEVEKEFQEKTLAFRVASANEMNHASATSAIYQQSLARTKFDTEMESMKRDFIRAKKNKDYAEMDAILDRIRKWVPFTSDMIK